MVTYRVAEHVRRALRTRRERSRPAATTTTAKPLTREYPTLKIAGFGDINFLATKRPEGARGFAAGQFVLHMTSELSPKVTFFGEVSLRRAPTPEPGRRRPQGSTPRSNA
jgi:hypothetical protein